MKQFFTILATFSLTISTFAQVGIGTKNPDTATLFKNNWYNSSLLGKNQSYISYIDLNHALTSPEKRLVKNLL
jgi:hypothetical protein